MIPYDDRVWEMIGRGERPYMVFGKAYPSAHDGGKTHVALIETNVCWGPPPCWTYEIKFDFKTRRAAVAWVKKMRTVISNRFKKARKDAKRKSNLSGAR